MSIYVLDLRVSKFSNWGLNLSDEQVAGLRTCAVYVYVVRRVK